MDTNENNNPNDPTPPSVPPPAPSAPPAGTPPAAAPTTTEHPSGISGDERLWGCLCHILPLIIWLIKREGLPFVDDQGKEALNFQITVFLALFGMQLLHIIPFMTCLLIPVSLGWFLLIAVFRVGSDNGWSRPTRIVAGAIGMLVLLAGAGLLRPAL